jgi:membrane protein YdbS with pleckstrin-like domain
VKPYIPVIVILLIFIPLLGGFGYLYYWVFTMAEFHWIFRTFIAVGALALIAALIGAAVQRIREIRREAIDDLSKY